MGIIKLGLIFMVLAAAGIGVATTLDAISGAEAQRLLIKTESVILIVIGSWWLVGLIIGRRK